MSMFNITIHKFNLDHICMRMYENVIINNIEYSRHETHLTQKITVTPAPGPCMTCTQNTGKSRCWESAWHIARGELSLCECYYDREIVQSTKQLCLRESA